jgi:hypothetical protein
MMSQRSKQEYLEAVRPRYKNASKAQKKQILDEFVATTGYHRKHAIRVLTHTPIRKPTRKRGRKKLYQGEVVVVLEQIWEICGQICSKRLHPFLPEMVKVLERTGRMQLSEEVKALLLQMSRPSIDRCLSQAHHTHPRSLSTTRPGTLLKKSIPVRTYTPWDEEKPGFLEIDLVAHCGNCLEGQFVYTLTSTDLATGWTECLPIFPRTQKNVVAALIQVQTRLPFPLLGLDSDNGSEFVNDLLLQHTRIHQITFTRSRPYKKNDQAHVEQKNGSLVRRLIGYDRLDTPQQFLLLGQIYQDLRLYANFFQPVLKLVGKEQVQGHAIKRYDIAATPYQRIQASVHIALDVKARLANQYVQLDPVLLRTSIDQKVDRLWKSTR